LIPDGLFKRMNDQPTEFGEIVQPWSLRVEKLKQAEAHTDSTGAKTIQNGLLECCFIGPAILPL